MTPQNEIDEMLSKVKQPYYDIEIGKICAWLKKHAYECHVTLAGEVRLVKKRDCNA